MAAALLRKDQTIKTTTGTTPSKTGDRHPETWDKLNASCTRVEAKAVPQHLRLCPPAVLRVAATPMVIITAHQTTRLLGIQIITLAIIIILIIAGAVATDRHILAAAVAVFEAAAQTGTLALLA